MSKASAMAKVAARFSGKSLSTVLLLLSLTAGGCSRGEPPQGAGGPPGFPVKLQSVERGTVVDSDEFPAILEAEERVDLRPVVDGRVSQIFVRSGDRVAAGDPIAQIDPQKDQAEVQSAIANVNARRAALDNARAEISALEAERASAVADVALQNEEFRRTSLLVSQGALARQQLDQVRREREGAIAALNAAEKRIQAARATLDQENAALKEAQATVTLRNEELRDTRVNAPIAGVVSDVTVKLGDSVDTSSTLTTIIQNQNLDLELPISGARSSQLRLGVPVQLVSDKGDDIIGTGQISFISPQVNTNSSAILAKASFPSSEGRLKDGQRVRARVIWDRSPGVLIPRTAISYLAGKPFVYVAQKPDPAQQKQPQQQGQGQPQQGQPPQLVARQKPVKLGDTQGNNQHILEGLEPGEKIIVSGILNLQDGAAIIPETQQSAMGDR